MSPTKHDNVLVWGSDIEKGTIDQAAMTSRLPIVAGHVALMPDAHIGKGSTVGSVIPTRGAVIPAAIGVDIGCVDMDTEYLGPNGWRRIADYNGERVMQYHSETGLGELVQPLRYIRRPETRFLEFRTKYGVNQALTADHRMLVWRPTGRDRTYRREVILAGDLAAEHGRLVLGSKVTIETTFTPIVSTSLPFDEDQVRVMVMVMADAHIERGTRAVLRLKKERKIDRAAKLLNAAGIDFTVHRSADEVTTIRFSPPSIAKSYETWWSASVDQLRVIADECLEWDGNRQDHVFFTRERASADFIQYAFTASGLRSVMRSDPGRDGELDYRVFGHRQTRVGIAGTPKTPVTSRVSHDGWAYCFTVPSGFLVLRRGGNVFMTGNCGMVAVETDLRSERLPDKLGKLLGDLAAVVPAGVGKGHEDENGGNSKRARAWHKFSNRTAMPPLELKQANTAFSQFGSLGSGNHFVEVCLDEREVIWLVLHSGSRGIGNQLATKHIEGAKGLMGDHLRELEDPDLASLVQGTPEFDAYIKAMLWSQDYAMANRQQMIDAAVPVLLEACGGGRVAETINCHHNFTQQERVGSEMLWVTRKGAIRASTGMKGVIPGSMGTRSYIVTGLGNPLSYDSCSHGAGRRLSRGRARRELTVESFNEAMAGKTWQDRDAEELLDEHPDSYKDIDQVMADQADLVTIEHTLTQVLNYKGVKERRGRR